MLPFSPHLVGNLPSFLFLTMLSLIWCENNKSLKGSHLEIKLSMQLISTSLSALRCMRASHLEVMRYGSHTGRPPAKSRHRRTPLHHFTLSSNMASETVLSPWCVDLLMFCADWSGFAFWVRNIKVERERDFQMDYFQHNSTNMFSHVNTHGDTAAL